MPRTRSRTEACSRQTLRRLRIFNKTNVASICILLGQHHQEGPLAMSFVRAAASVAIVVLLLTGAATAKPIATLAETNLRRAAGTDSEVLTLIPKGTAV